MTAPKPKRKSSSSRPPTSTSKSSPTSPNLTTASASAILHPEPTQSAQDNKTANQSQQRSRTAKPISASPKPVSSASGSAQASGSTSTASAGGPARDRKAPAKGRASSVTDQDNKPLATAAAEPSRKTSRSAANAARHKTAVAITSTQIDKHDQQQQEQEQDEDEDEDEDDEDEDDSGITRCVCGKETEDLASGLMIECDTCKAWQHGPCVGLLVEKDCPDTYYCELCRPDLHDHKGLLIRSTKTSRKPPAHQRSPSISQPSPQVEPLSTSTSSRSKPRPSLDSPAPAPAPTRPTHYSPPAPATAPAHSPETVHHPDDPKAALDHSQKKRSTMNSRDAAYDDAIALSILEAGSAAARNKLQRGQSGEDDDEVDRIKRASEDEQGGTGHKRRRLSGAVDEAESIETNEHKGGRPPSPELGGPSIGGLAEASPPNSNKVKHPNQYTYRPKPAAGTTQPRPPKSPTKKVPLTSTAPTVSLTTDLGLPPLPTLPTPVPSSRNGAPARARGDGGASAARDLENGGWGIPEHLKHLRHLLPSATPGFLDVPCPAPDSAELGPDDNLLALDPSPGPTKREPATRVRFPGKRMTMPEMRKRAKNVLEYMGRVQVELREREERGDRVRRARRHREGLDHDAADEDSEREGAAAAESKAESLRMMDGLTREILAFQQKYFGGLD